ncbi:MAG: AAA family ATPase, partial [Chloroflexi bacterium]|nr:AAA family ATPase [Chloroflexota bacterium]
DVPHPAVGRARRMQVATPSLQHEVMIEAVENHNPEVIVIDEIGRELEAEAARTIAERGVQLIGTAHGNTLENLLINPTLSDLIGGIESVTLSDEEARRRGTQKTVLERRSPPTFDVLIEIQTRDSLAVHADVASAVDAMLRGYPQQPEQRSRDEQGKINIQKAAPLTRTRKRTSMSAEGPRRTNGGRQAKTPRENVNAATRTGASESLDAIKIYPYGVARNRLANASKRMRVPAVMVRDVGEADVLVTLRSYYRKRQRTVIDAEQRGMPVYVLRANTVNQMERFLGDLFNLSGGGDDEDAQVDQTVSDTQLAIEAVLNGERWVELSPVTSYLRRLQHKMARQAKLVSHSYGKEPNRRVRIFRE